MSTLAKKPVLLQEPTEALYHEVENGEKRFKVIYRGSFKGEELENVLFVYEHEHSLGIGAAYVHSKNQRLYRVICLVISPETSKLYVLYQAQYFSAEFGDKAYWVREIDNFTEEVETSFGMKPRFESRGR